MNLVVFLVVLIVSFIVVRIGAIAFQLTGLEWSVAKFQALSCFPSTGFTTREAELITGRPQRRRIASVLIVLGHAGLVTMIATFANSLRPQIVGRKLSVPFVRFDVPGAVLPWINLMVAVVAVYFIYRIFTNTKVARRLTDSLRRRIIKRAGLRPISFEELLLAKGGYGVSNVRISEEHPISGKTLSESGLRKEDIIVLAIVRADETFANPSADRRILAGDELVCFGKLDNIRQEFA